MQDINDTSFVIENWMTSELGLSGSRLLIFALVWSKADKQGKATCTFSDMSKICNIGNATTWNTMQKLREADLITLEKNKPPLPSTLTINSQLISRHRKDKEKVND